MLIPAPGQSVALPAAGSTSGMQRMHDPGWLAEQGAQHTTQHFRTLIRLVLVIAGRLARTRATVDYTGTVQLDCRVPDRASGKPVLLV